MPPILSLQQLCKQYPGVVALDHVDLTVEKGEVRALLGKNGAGKSTLVKILSGAVHPDSGEIRIDGQPVTIAGPADAFAQGICTVYQEMSLVPGLTVAENILLGRWPKQRLLGMSVIDRKAIRPIAQAALDQFEVKLNLDETVSRLSVAQQQLIEIAKAISFNPRVLVLDEPTSALASGEVDVLHKVVRRLAEQGHAIIYVTHRLQEIPHVADSVTVLRDGRHIGTITAAEATPAVIANMMIGADWRRTEWGETKEAGEVKLAVKGLNRQDLLHDISFEVRGGEVLGIAGLLGSGRTELVRAIFGLDKMDSGEIYVKGERITHPTPVNMKAHGVGFTPEDRKRQGLVLPFAVRDNLTMASMNRFSVQGVLQPATRHCAGEGDGPVAGDQDPRPGRADGHAERRQPAEGGRRQLAEHAARNPADGRAHPRHRHPGQGTDLHPGARPRQPGVGRAFHFVGDRRGAGRRRSHPDHEPGAHHRRSRSRTRSILRYCSHG